MTGPKTRPIVAVPRARNALEGVERTRADVAEHDAERREGQKTKLPLRPLVRHIRGHRGILVAQCPIHYENHPAGDAGCGARCANDHLQHVITSSPYPMSHRTTMPMEGSRRVEGTLGADIYAIR